MATPMVRTVVTTGSRQESNAVVCRLERRYGDLVGLGGPPREQGVELSRVVEIAADPGREGDGDVEHRSSDLLLQVAVSLPDHPLLDGPDVFAGEGALDAQQVGDTRLADRVGDDLAPGVGDRTADLLLDDVRLVEQPDAARSPDALAHLLLDL